MELHRQATAHHEIVVIIVRSVLRQQINVLRRANPKRLRFATIDRLVLGGVCRLFPKMYGALAIVRPETVIRWHRGDLDRIGDGNRSSAADDRP